MKPTTTTVRLSWQDARSFHRHTSFHGPFLFLLPYRQETKTYAPQASVCSSSLGRCKSGAHGLQPSRPGKPVGTLIPNQAGVALDPFKLNVKRGVSVHHPKQPLPQVGVSNGLAGSSSLELM